MNRVEVTAKNTYEASYYMCCGGKVDAIRVHRLPVNTKKTYRDQWIFEMSNVPDNLIEKYREGTARINIKYFEAERKRLKKMVDKTINNKAL